MLKALKSKYNHHRKWRKTFLCAQSKSRCKNQEKKKMHVLSSQENGPHKDKNVKLLLIGTPRESTSKQRIRVPHSCKKVATMKIFLLKTCLVSLTPLLLAILRYVHHKLLPLHSSSNPRVYSNSACMHACRTFALSVAPIAAAPPLRIGIHINILQN